MRALCCVLALLLPSWARAEGNLLRNGKFQDDWQTHLPELKNHHWNYTTEVHNRRDFNPDGWQLSGKWQWRDADKPRGGRRLVLSSGSRVVQSINWITVHNSARLAGWPDAGGFPTPEALRSKDPLALVRDLTFRVRLSGRAVPRNGVTLTVAWSGSCPVDDPAGSKRILSSSTSVPEGTYANKTIEVKLPAVKWLAAAKKDPTFAAQGALLPMAATCEIVYAAKQTGSVELLQAMLTEPGPGKEHLLGQGDFQQADGKGYPRGWSRPRKYRYFPPGIYYIFNTWHNSNSANRGATTRDGLIAREGRHSLRMVVPSGDEVCVVSDPILLHQKEARLIEVRAWIKTHHLNMLQIDAEDDRGRRLDGFTFIHKRQLSIGTEDWRLVRQVFRPAGPLKSLRLKLCARGMNGYTLDGTGQQPQQNVAGIIWWDDVRVFEPESKPEERKARRVKAVLPREGKRRPHLAGLDLGEGLLGRNALTAQIVNPGKEETFALRLAWSKKDSRKDVLSAPVRVGPGKSVPVQLTYTLSEPGRPYQAEEVILQLLRIRGGKREVIGSSSHAVATWTVPLDLRLGALYLGPAQKQFVRINLGLAHAEIVRLKEVRLEVLRRGAGKVLKTFTLPATPEAIRRQRAKVPDGLRGDLRNLLLADLDVSFLPVQPFADPQRNWVIRATSIDTAGKPGWSITSAPFCRLAHDGPQQAIRSVRISEQGDFLINDRPWMPWGVAYGHNPVYDGPANSGKYHDLGNLKPWGVYDRHGGSLADRSRCDLNCVRYVEGAVVKPAQLDALWKQGLYASTVFLPPPRGGKPWDNKYLKYLGKAPMVAALSRGPEEAFGYFSPLTARQIEEIKTQVAHLKKSTGKPIMVGHGGYWTRLELERVPFFDIYDPETEPWYPAPVHTDLKPLVEGKKKVVWLRPQMYESVPYERWRYHVFVELMRGVRGWQIAHGPGDSSTFRGLHAELRHLQPAIYSKEKAPDVKIDPGVEHLVRRLGKKVIIVAATTHGMSFGNWRWSEEKSPAGRARVTAGPHVFGDESDGYHAISGPARQSLCPHGIQYVGNPRKWPAGSKLVTWVKLDPKARPKNLVALVKADGRWTHAASWGKWDVQEVRKDNARAFWFLRTFYRHARGFLGWSDRVPPHALAFIPSKTTRMGDLPPGGKWVKVEVALDKIAAAGKLIDGVGFLHDGGRAWWADTRLKPPAGSRRAGGQDAVLFGAHEDRPAPDRLAKTRIAVAGLKKGAKVRVLFEDREVVAQEGHFVDDFRGVDLYQRYGGERSGYGNAPVALHVYEVMLP
jgi:hypothetical protein